MLTPSNKDPNRKKELKRKAKDPFSFGYDPNITHVDIPDDWSGDSGSGDSDIDYIDSTDSIGSIDSGSGGDSIESIDNKG